MGGIALGMYVSETKWSLAEDVVVSATLVLGDDVIMGFPAFQTIIEIGVLWRRFLMSYAFV